MSLTAAAAALNAPEVLVQRSAEARAKVSGASVDDILSAWAGGAPAPAATSTPTTTPAAQPPPAEAAPDEPREDVADIPVVAAQAPAAEAVPTGQRSSAPVVPPVLFGRRESPMAIMVSSGAILTLSLVIGLFSPATPEPGNGVRSSAIAYSASGLEGKSVYLAENCAACHTQHVRPIAADAGKVERVTLSDSNQVLGSMRLGPDLSNVWARLDPAAVADVLNGNGGHPSFSSLDSNQLANLVAYLTESS